MQLDIDPDAKPSVRLLEDRLHKAADEKARHEEEKKTREKGRKDKDKSANTRSYGVGTRTPGHPNKPKEDKSHLKCEHYDATGHTQDDCWKLHPNKMPRALKEKIAADKTTSSETTEEKTAGKADTKLKKKFTAIARLPNLQDFKQKLADAKSQDVLGMTHPPHNTHQVADSGPQDERSQWNVSGSGSDSGVEILNRDKVQAREVEGGLVVLLISTNCHRWSACSLMPRSLGMPRPVIPFCHLIRSRISATCVCS